MLSKLGFKRSSVSHDLARPSNLSAHPVTTTTRGNRTRSPSRTRVTGKDPLLSSTECGPGENKVSWLGSTTGSQPASDSTGLAKRMRCSQTPPVARVSALTRAPLTSLTTLSSAPISSICILVNSKGGQAQTPEHLAYPSSQRTSKVCPL